jgi:hypothetical protein
MMEFHTIYPGWYPGRTVHIHLLVRVGTATLTSQLHCPDDITDQVLSQSPYEERPGRDTTNVTDQIFLTGGESAVLDVAPDGDGYRTAICLIFPTAERTPRLDRDRLVAAQQVHQHPGVLSRAVRSLVLDGEMPSMARRRAAQRDRGRGRRAAAGRGRRPVGDEQRVVVREARGRRSRS